MKKIYQSIFLIFIFMWVMHTQCMLTRRLPLRKQGLSTRVMRPAATTQPLGKRSIHGQQPSTSWLAWQAAAIANRATALKNSFSRWWFAQPAFSVQQTDLSVPTIQAKKPEVMVEKSLSVSVDKPVAIQSDAQIEAQEIVAKLKGPNPWLYRDEAEILKSPLAVQIKKFLEKNSLDDIELCFIELLESDEGCILLEKMCKADSHFAVKIIPLMENNYHKKDTVSKLFVLAAILSNVPKEKASLVENLMVLFFKDASAHEMLYRFPSVMSNIPGLLPNDKGKIVILMKLLIEKISSDKIYRFNRREDYDKMISRLLNMFALKINYVTPEDLVKITESLKSITKDAPDIIKNLLSKSQNVKEVLDLIDSYKDTPSYRHIQKYSELLGDLNFDNTDMVEFKRFIAGCCDKEKEFGQDYEIFYHGRRWQYNYLSDLYAVLYGHQSGKPLKDFIFTHLIEQGIIPSKKFIESERIKRERLIKEGNPFSHDTHLPEHDPALITEQKRATLQQMIGFGNRQTLLFLNKFLFGNIGKRGSCTMSYVLEDSNIGKINFSFKEIFSMFGYGEVLRMYERELFYLYSEHEQLTRCGELLQILVPKDTVDKSVYYTTSGGPKKTFYIPGEGNTTDLKKILKYLDENPKNIVEFVLVNTQDEFGGLSPNSGIKVFSHNVVDPAKMAEFKAKQKELFDRILQSCREYDEQKKQKAIEQEKAQLASE